MESESYTGLKLLAQAVPVVALCLIVIYTLWKHHLDVLEDSKKAEESRRELERENLVTLKDVANAIENNNTAINRHSDVVNSCKEELKGSLDDIKSASNKG